MYFIEALIKKIIDKKNKSFNFNPLNENKQNMPEAECEHIFMPIDSTQETLSCTKCGILIKREELHNQNFFEQK